MDPWSLHISIDYTRKSVCLPKYEKGDDDMLCKVKQYLAVFFLLICLSLMFMPGDVLAQAEDTGGGVASHLSQLDRIRKRRLLET